MEQLAFTDIFFHQRLKQHQKIHTMPGQTAFLEILMRDIFFFLMSWKITISTVHKASS